MLEQLMARRYLCQDEHINAFYNHIPRACNDNCGDCNYSWEINSTGYFLHGKSSVTYFRFLDGMVFRFMRWYHPQDIEMLKELNQLSLDSGDFRIEKIIIHDIVRYNGDEYLYYVSQRPNKEFGLTGVEEALTCDRQLFFKEFIDQFATFIPYIVLINKKYGLGPSLSNLHIMSSRARDSLGHYWKNIRIFKVPPQQVIEESKKRLFIASSSLEHARVKDIMEYANQKWKLS
jgi:hypothetical protein